MSSNRLASADWLTLNADETVEWHGRPSLVTIAPQIALAALVGVGGAVALSVVGSAVGTLPGIVYLLPFVASGSILAVVILRWYRIEYVITTRAVYIKRGFLSLDIEQIRIARIQNTTLSQSLVERLLGYGDVIAYTAGSDSLNIEFASVPNPSQVNRTLSELMDRRKNEPLAV